MITLWTAGFTQGGDWLEGGIPFIETVVAMKPYMLVRLISGLVIAVGVAAFFIGVVRTLLPEREHRLQTAEA